MHTQNPKNDKSRPQAPQFTDVSRFTRMLSHLDHKDKELDPGRRKRKWVIIMAGLLGLFLVSFLFPFPELSHQKIGSEMPSLPADTSIFREEESSQPGFEMPVDSFENRLKQHIHENLSEKE